MLHRLQTDSLEGGAHVRAHVAECQIQQRAAGGYAIVDPLR